MNAKLTELENILNKIVSNTEFNKIEGDAKVAIKIINTLENDGDDLSDERVILQSILDGFHNLRIHVNYINNYGFEE